VKLPIGNVFRESLADIWNGPNARRIRESIHDGSFRFCGECPFLQGAPSGPVMDRSAVSNERHLAWMNTGTTEVAEVDDLNLAYDRTCNISCPSCRKSVIVEKGPTLRYLAAVQSRTLAGEALAKIRWLWITGSGDPFASKTYRDLLRSIDPARYPNLSVRLHTNGLLFDEDAWLGLGAARNIVRTVCISIDAATKETYEVNRRGGNFDTLQERLAFVAELRRRGPVRRLEFFFVVQANNFREMPAFAELAREFGADAVLFTPLRNWGTFDDREYAERAVHRPEHAEHAEYRRVRGAFPVILRLSRTGAPVCPVDSSPE
jgi:MoaA/NifB/PqqE/SkfB family radical SAM enzyme